MRKGFTLIELIFVIIIIGILAAAAIPQFQNLKQSAEANNVIKVTTDAAASAVSAAVNHIDLEDENLSTYGGLDGLVTVSGKGWNYDDTSGNKDGNYSYTDPQGNTADNTVAYVKLNASDRNVTYNINCNNFVDADTQKKCVKTLDTNITAVTLTF